MESDPIASGPIARIQVTRHYRILSMSPQPELFVRHPRSLVLVPALFFSVSLGAQAAPPGGMVHTPGMKHTPGMEHPSPAQPEQGGHAAFATIQEIVKILEADSTTDWAKVDLEALRQHLIDMDLVTMRARVSATKVPGGLVMDVTGQSDVAAAIRRMLPAHAPTLQAVDAWNATTTALPNGTRMTVVARRASDTATVNRIRGLGFIGLMTTGAHHQSHHLMIAKGAGAHAHGAP